MLKPHLHRLIYIYIYCNKCGTVSVRTSSCDVALHCMGWGAHPLSGAASHRSLSLSAVISEIDKALGSCVFSSSWWCDVFVFVIVCRRRDGINPRIRSTYGRTPCSEFAKFKSKSQGHLGPIHATCSTAGCEKDCFDRITGNFWKVRQLHWIQ